MQTVSNGLGPRLEQDGDALMERIEGELREAIAAERVNRTEAEQVVEASRAREKLLQKALDALTGQTSRPPREHATRKRDWNISDEKVELVFDAIKRRRLEVGRAVTQTEVADANPGLSPESVRRGLEVLRSQERIRITGKVRGGGNSWDLMPGAVGDGA